MAAMPNNSITQEIAAHIKKEGGHPSTWYVGIASDVRRRLFVDHQVPEKEHWYIFREAFSAQDARAIEKAFLEWGCDGGPGGGDQSTTWVYAYKKASFTRQ